MQVAPVFRKRVVRLTAEVARVLSLPRRQWHDDPDLPAFARQLTERLATGHRGMYLRPAQAQALYEIGTVGGALLPMRVGSGKTLISALAPTVLGSERPLLLVPAHLREKTRAEFRELACHWRVPAFYRVESYQMLSRIAELLETFGPDLIFADEAHYLKNLNAGVTRRLRRYLEANPRCRFVAASGTITRTSIHDFVHLLLWALGAPNTPLPMQSREELRDWAAVLDSKDRDVDPGPLIRLKVEGYDDERESIRAGYQRRLTETPGVVATRDKPSDVGSSLTIRHLRGKPPPDVLAALANLRVTWETPDGWPLFDGKDVARHARELLLGFFYAWTPRPPKPWLAARKAWSQACRHILTHNQRNLDTQKSVVDALEHYPEAQVIHAAWKEIEPTFVINTVPVWISDYAIQHAKLWLRDNVGIVWTEHRAFAEALEKATGVSYYGRSGKNSAGQSIPQVLGIKYPDAEPCIASIKANSTGRNLQHMSRSLIVSPMANAALWEQNLGRQHRELQRDDEVMYDVLMLGTEHDAAWEEALRMSRYEEQITGQEQKLGYANVVDQTLDKT